MADVQVLSVGRNHPVTDCPDVFLFMSQILGLESPSPHLGLFLAQCQGPIKVGPSRFHIVLELNVGERLHGAEIGKPMRRSLRRERPRGIRRDRVHAQQIAQCVIIFVAGKSAHHRGGGRLAGFNGSEIIRQRRNHLPSLRNQRLSDILFARRHFPEV